MSDRTPSLKDLMRRADRLVEDGTELRPHPTLFTLENVSQDMAGGVFCWSWPEGQVNDQASADARELVETGVLTFCVPMDPASQRAARDTAADLEEAIEAALATTAEAPCTWQSLYLETRGRTRRRVLGRLYFVEMSYTFAYGRPPGGE